MELFLQLGRAIVAGVDDEEIADHGGDEGSGAAVEALAEERCVGDEAMVVQVLLEDSAQVAVKDHGRALEALEPLQETSGRLEPTCRRSQGTRREGVSSKWADLMAGRQKALRTSAA